MKREYIFGTMMALALAAGSSARINAAQDPNRQSGSTKEKVVVTGCLMAGAGAATGTAGSTGSTSSGTSGTSGTTGSSTNRASKGTGSFILTNAVMGGSGASTAGTAGSASRSGAGAASGSSFILSGGRRADLQRYMNSRVEVTGTLDASTSAGAGSSTGSTGSTAPTGGRGSTAGSATASGAPGTMSGQTPSQRLRVSSIRKVEGTCSGAGHP